MCLLTQRWIAMALVSGAAALGGGGPPVIHPAGVVNAGDYTAVLAPGMHMAVFGANLALRTRVAETAPLPETLEGASVEIVQGARTLRAPLVFVSPGQINAQLPYEITGPEALVRVRNAAGVSGQVAVAVRPCVPRLLTKTMDGKGEAILLHPDYRLVSEAAPAPPGGVVLLYLLGLGAVTPPVAAGARAGDGQRAPLNEAEAVPTVWIGSAKAEVLWSGLAPYYAGLYQLNIQMPRFLPQGRHSIEVALSGESSQPGVWVAGGEPLWRSVVTAAIGPGGGTVSGAGLELALPWGGVSAETEMSISAPLAGDAPSGALATGVWKVSGLPLETTAPLSLRLPLASAQAPAGSALVFVKSESEPDAGLAVLPATIRDGRLEATLPATAPASAPQREGQREALIIPKQFTATVWGMAGFSPIKSPAGKFTVFVPRGDDRDFEAAEDTGRILEEALQKLKAIGIETDARRTTPIDVYLFPFSALPANLFLLDDGLEGMTESEFWGREDMGLTLNLNSYHNHRERFRRAAGHELFHLFQSYYDPRRWGQRTFTGASWLWLWEAASTWFEQKMSSAGPAHLADVTRANADFLFRGGLEKPPDLFTSTAARRHGYGAALFLQHFIRGNDRRVGDLIKRSAESTGLVLPTFRYTPVDALRLEEPLLADRWVDFCQQYLEGKVHPAVDFKLLTLDDKARSIVPSYTFATAADPGTTFRWQAPNLSAAHYQLKFTRATLNWAADTTLTLRLRDPNRKALAFVYRTGSGPAPVLIGRFNDEHRIANAESLVDGRTGLYLLVVNPHYEFAYTGTTAIELEAQVQAGTPQFRNVDVRTYNSTRSQNDRYLSNRVELPGAGAACDLRWSANAFQSSCRAIDGKEVDVRETTGLIHPSGLTLISLDITAHRTYANGSTGTRRFSIRNLPNAPVSGGNIRVMIFRITGKADVIRQYAPGWSPAMPGSDNDTFILEVTFSGAP